MQATAESMHLVATMMANRNRRPAPDPAKPVTAGANNCADCKEPCHGERCRACHARHHFSNTGGPKAKPHCLDCKKPVSVGPRCRPCSGKNRRVA